MVLYLSQPSQERKGPRRPVLLHDTCSVQKTHRETAHHPVRSCCPEAERGTEEGYWEKNWQWAQEKEDGSAGHRINLISEKLCYVTSNKQKWRRAECSVAIDDDRHIYRRKTIMKEGQEGERNPRKKIIGQWDKHEEVSQGKKEKYLEPVRERRAGPKDWRRRGPWWREEGKREE